MNVYNIYLIAAPLSFTALMVTLWVTKRRGDHPGLRPLQGVLFCCLLTVFFQVLELLMTAPALIMICSHSVYLVVVLLPVFWLLFIRDYLKIFRYKKDSLTWMLFFIPLITILLKITNSLHGWLWREYAIVEKEGYLINMVTDYGFWFWIHSFYCYSLYLFGVFRLMFHIGHVALIYRKQFWLLIGGTAVPLVLPLIYIFRLIPGMDKDFSILGMSLMAILFAVNMRNFHLFDSSAFLPYKELQQSEGFYIEFSENGTISEAYLREKKVLPQHLFPGQNLFLSYPFLKKAVSDAKIMGKGLFPLWTGKIDLLDTRYRVRLLVWKTLSNTSLLLYASRLAKNRDELLHGLKNFAEKAPLPIILLGHPNTILYHRGIEGFSGFPDNALFGQDAGKILPLSEDFTEGNTTTLFYDRDKLPMKLLLSVTTWYSEETRDNIRILSIHAFYKLFPSTTSSVVE